MDNNGRNKKKFFSFFCGGGEGNKHTHYMVDRYKMNIRIFWSQENNL